MTKKKIGVILVVVGFIFIIGGFFWWQQDKIERFLESKKIEKMVAPSKDYNVIENSGEKFLINKKDEFKIKIPIGWEIELGDDMEILKSDREVTLYSEDFSYRPPQGCLIRIQINRLQKTWIEEYGVDFVMYPFEGAEEIKEMINSYKEIASKEKEIIQERGAEIILVGQKEALWEQEAIGLGEVIGKYITIKVPTENKVYIFRNTQFSERCDEELENFLETISIE